MSRKPGRKGTLPEGVVDAPEAKDWTPEMLAGRFVRSESGRPFEKIARSDVRDQCTWLCDKGHEYQATRGAHRHNVGCPTCRKSIATRMPGLAELWNAKRNRRSADDASIYDRKRRWWTCEHGHRVSRSPATTYASGFVCRTCKQEGLEAWNVATHANQSNSLATQVPDIAAEWHPTLNPRGPEEYGRGSQVEVFWLCENGHTWSSPICHRTSNKHRSPARCQTCVSLRYKKPDIAAELHPTLNPPDYDLELRMHSTEMVYWLCDRGHTWSSSVVSRTRELHPTTCTVCRSLEGRLPNLIKACWAYEFNDDAGINPREKKRTDKDQAWWIRPSSLHIPKEQRIREELMARQNAEVERKQFEAAAKRAKAAGKPLKTPPKNFTGLHYKYMTISGRVKRYLEEPAAKEYRLIKKTLGRKWDAHEMQPPWMVEKKARRKRA